MVLKSRISENQIRKEGERTHLEWRGEELRRGNNNNRRRSSRSRINRPMETECRGQGGGFRRRNPSQNRRDSLHVHFSLSLPLSSAALSITESKEKEGRKLRTKDRLTHHKYVCDYLIHTYLLRVKLVCFFGLSLSIFDF